MNTPARLAFSLCFGLMAALGLFMLMNFLVSRGEMGVDAKHRQPLPQFIRLDDQEQIVRRRELEKPKPPEELKPLPRLEAVTLPRQTAAQAPSFDMPAFDFSTDLALVGLPVAAPEALPGPPTGPAAYTQPLTPISQIPPEYPRWARMQGISGWVRLEFIVNPDGSVSDVTVLEALPRKGIFDQEAVRALGRWRFHPQIEDGRPVPAMATITIVFKLEG